MTALFTVPSPLGWFPDETLYSLASRHHKLAANPRASDTCLQLFGHHRQGSQHDLPVRLDEFVRRTNGQLGTAETILAAHTILPFYLPFRSAAQTADAIAAVRGSSLGSLKYRLGILTSRFRANHPLKACLACLASDRTEVGVAYWHVSHQLPGVWVCPTHGTELLEATIKANGVGRFLWYLPSEAILVARVPEEPDAVRRTRRQDLLQRLERAAVAVAGLPLTFRFDLQRLRQTYLRALETRGLRRVESTVRLQAVATNYMEALETVDGIPEFSSLPSSPQDSISQIGQLLRDPVRPSHPLRHLMFLTWLFGTWDSFWRAYSVNEYAPATSGAWDNDTGSPTAQGAIPIDIRKLRLLRLVRSQELSVSRAASAVNVSVGTAMAWLAKEGLPTPRRPKLLTEPIRQQLIDDLRRGEDKAVAASRYKVSVQTVTATLRTEPGLAEGWHRTRTLRAKRGARTTWAALMRRHPNAGIAELRASAPAAYAWLYRNDRAWLERAELKIPPAIREPRPRVDWDARDAGLANQVQATGLELAASSSSKKIPLWAIYQRLPELKAKLGALDRLPLTQRAIEAITKHLINEPFTGPLFEYADMKNSNQESDAHHDDASAE